MRKSTFKAPVAYFAVVLIGYIADLMVYAGLVLAGHGVIPANVLAFFVGTSINAVLVRKWVFDDHRFGAGSDFAMTLIFSVLFFLLGTWILAWLVSGGLVNPYLSKVIINAATFGCNFGIRALFLRKK